MGFSGEFNLQAFYRSAYQWFKHHGYDIDEKQYKEYREGGKRKLFIHWANSKRIDDYAKYVHDVRFQLNNLESTKKDTVTCDMTITFMSWLLKDYDDVWARKSWMKFVRDAYDKFVIRSRMDELEHGLQHEVDSLITELRAFLNLMKSKQRSARGASS